MEFCSGKMRLVRFDVVDDKSCEFLRTSCTFARNQFFFCFPKINFVFFFQEKKTNHSKLLNMQIFKCSNGLLRCQRLKEKKAKKNRIRSKNHT